LGKGKFKMKTLIPRQSKRRRIFSRRSSSIPNRWLLLNMQTFNFASGWNQIVARAQTQQFSG
jgi:hypothetical protein